MPVVIDAAGLCHVVTAQSHHSEMEPTIEATGLFSHLRSSRRPYATRTSIVSLPTARLQVFRVGCVVFLLLLGLVLFHRFFPAELEQVCRTIFFNGRNSIPRYFG